MWLHWLVTAILAIPVAIVKWTLPVVRRGVAPIHTVLGLVPPKPQNKVWECLQLLPPAYLPLPFPPLLAALHSCLGLLVGNKQPQIALRQHATPLEATAAPGQCQLALPRFSIKALLLCASPSHLIFTANFLVLLPLRHAQPGCWAV